MALSLLLILTITTLNSGAQSSLPKVSYIKAIDVWFIGNCHFGLQLSGGISAEDYM